MFKVSLDRLNDLFAVIAQNRILYLPVARGEVTDFGQWAPGTSVRLDYLNPVRSIKDFFLPQTEDIVAFKREGKKITITPNAKEPAPFVVFGVRGCDARSLDVLDRVFLSDPVDTFYKAQRDHGIIISLACAEPEETCFCGAFGIDATEPQGDVVTRIAGDFLYWEAKTPAGESLSETLKNILAEASSEDKAKAAELRKASKEIMENLPLARLSLDGWGSENLMEKFEAAFWEKLSMACIGCGTCTYVCPTCQCYDIRDFDTGNDIKRFRCWDSCMFSDFTLMAHGNPRKTQLERFRQRFMHKLVYYPEKNGGMYSCVGCGRCVSKCSISMNIVKVIKAPGVKENV